jgi:trk system potassium uptake protein TrkA
MLEKLGADEVLFPERDMGRRIAHNLVSGSIIDYLELSPDYSMAEIRPKREWIGRTLKDLALRSSMGINVVAIRSGESLNAMPTPETVLQEEDVLLVVISEKTLKTLG